MSPRMRWEARVICHGHIWCRKVLYTRTKEGLWSSTLPFCWDNTVSHFLLLHPYFLAAKRGIIFSTIGQDPAYLIRLLQAFHLQETSFRVFSKPEFPASSRTQLRSHLAAGALNRSKHSFEGCWPQEWASCSCTATQSNVTSVLMPMSQSYVHSSVPKAEAAVAQLRITAWGQDRCARSPARNQEIKITCMSFMSVFQLFAFFCRNFL